MAERDSKGRFVDGHEGLRKKGTPNRISASMRDAFMEAFNSEQLGGVQGLIDWAASDKNRKWFYMMCTRLIPREVNMAITQPRPLMIDAVTQADVAQARADEESVH